jgi:phytoene dehydrogenase-like protein
MDVDVVVIGSGAGGLTAAVALARAGKKVLVVEQHYLPGGWCHSFNLDKHRFSPGVHYIGETYPGGRMRAILDGLDVRDISFLELNPDGFDHVQVGSDKFDICKGRARLAERLADRFPRERKGIHAYLSAVERIGDELGALFEIRPRDLWRLPFRARTALRWALSSTRSLVNSHVTDPLLRAILVAQSGDHGLPPSQAPALLHASVVHHYFGGGFYPKGGGGSIPRAFIRSLRRAGGDIKVRTEVTQILLEGRRAIGVRLADGTEVRADIVVSNADPQVTYGKLLPRAALSRKLVRRLARTRWSTSSLSLFFATDMDLRAAGYDSGNYWYYPTTDIERTYRMGKEPWGPDVPELPGFFLTVTTLKDPSKMKGGHHSMEAFTFVGYDAWKGWEESKVGERPAEYNAWKERLMDKMIANADRIVPGLRDRVTFAELGTPLTNKFYCAATAGNLYGTEKTLGQLGPFSYPVTSEIDGLYLCGASTLGHGVMGAALSGIAVAKSVLRVRSAEILAPRAAAPPREAVDAAA